MNQGIGLTLFVTLFPHNLLRALAEKGLTVFFATQSGILPDGTMFKVLRGVDINESQLNCMSLRKVVLRRNVVLTLDQIELLHSRNRGRLKEHEFISVE